MPPKRILFTTLGSLGDMFPYLALALEMQRRGHLATILTTLQHRSRVEQSGVQFREAAPNLDFSEKTFQERAMHETNGSRFMLRDVMLPHIRVSYENMLEASAHVDLCWPACGGKDWHSLGLHRTRASVVVLLSGLSGFVFSPECAARGRAAVECIHQ